MRNSKDELKPCPIKAVYEKYKHHDKLFEDMAKSLWDHYCQETDDTMPFDIMMQTQPLVYKKFIAQAQAIRDMMMGQTKVKCTCHIGTGYPMKNKCEYHDIK